MVTNGKRESSGHRTSPASGIPWAFFTLAFGFTWLICLPGVLAGRGLIVLAATDVIALVAVAQFGPSLAAFILTFRQDGGKGALALLKRALHFRMPIRWLAVTLLLPTVLAAGAYSLNLVTGGIVAAAPLIQQPLLIVPDFVFILLLQGPVPEEFGWRGYALDRLQARWSALTASLVLGVVWAVWHLPTFFMPGVYQSYLPLWVFLITVVAEAVLITWVYNSTNRNLLVALLFHAMINLSIAVFPPIDPAVGANPRALIYLAALYVVAATAVVAIWGPATLSGSLMRSSDQTPQPKRDRSEGVDRRASEG